MKCPHCKIDPDEVAEHTKDYMINILQNVRIDEFGPEFMSDLSCHRCGNLNCHCPSKSN